jgi:hypothetical protein
LKESVEAYCPMLEKDVHLWGKAVSRNAFLPEECSEKACPMKGSLSCLLHKLFEVWKCPRGR